MKPSLALWLLIFCIPAAHADHSLEYAIQDSRSVYEGVRGMELKHNVFCDKRNSEQLAPVRYENNDFKNSQGEYVAWRQVADCYNMAMDDPRFCTEARFAGKKIEIQYHWDIEGMDNPMGHTTIRSKGLIFGRIQKDPARNGMAVECANADQTSDQ